MVYTYFFCALWSFVRLPKQNIWSILLLEDKDQREKQNTTWNRNSEQSTTKLLNK